MTQITSRAFPQDSMVETLTRAFHALAGTDPVVEVRVRPTGGRQWKFRVWWSEGPSVAEVRSALRAVADVDLDLQHGHPLHVGQVAVTSIREALGPVAVHLRTGSSRQSMWSVVLPTKGAESLTLGGAPLVDVFDAVALGAPLPVPTMVEVADWLASPVEAARLAGLRLASLAP